MADTFEFLLPTDKPALVAVSNPDLKLTAHAELQALGYKVHSVVTHEEFLSRFTAVPYQVVIIEDTFATTSVASNASLAALQHMPMIQRRHATVFVVGSAWQTMNPMQAFRQSAHAVVNSTDTRNLRQILESVIADNAMFMSVFRDTQTRLAQGKV